MKDRAVRRGRQPIRCETCGAVVHRCGECAALICGCRDHDQVHAQRDLEDYYERQVARVARHLEFFGAEGVWL